MMTALAIVIGLIVVSPIIATLVSPVRNFVQAYDDLVVIMLIANILVISIGWTVGMKIGFEIAGITGGMVGLFGFMIAGALGAVLSEDLM
jgi:hypothetical protein